MALSHTPPQVYAVYGCFFIALSYLWGWAVDGVRPDAGDWVGSGVAMAGGLLAFFWPGRLRPCWARPSPAQPSPAQPLCTITAPVLGLPPLLYSGFLPSSALPLSHQFHFCKYRINALSARS